MARPKKVEEDFMPIEGMSWQNEAETYDESFCETDSKLEEMPIEESCESSKEVQEENYPDEGEAENTEPENTEPCCENFSQCPVQPAEERCCVKKRKFEFSKFMVILCFLIGVASIVAYYFLVYLAVTNPGTMVTPDSSLAVSGMTEIVGSTLGYYLYQGFLKNSRNKYNVDDVGKPWENIRWKK